MFTFSVISDKDTVQISAHAKQGDISSIVFITSTREEVEAALWCWENLPGEEFEIPNQLLIYKSGLCATVTGQTVVMTDKSGGPSVVNEFITILKEATK